jgi:hypothetical protein
MGPLFYKISLREFFGNGERDFCELPGAPNVPRPLSMGLRFRHIVVRPVLEVLD